MKKKRIYLALAMIATLGLASCDNEIELKPINSGETNNETSFNKRGNKDDSESKIELPDVLFEKEEEEPKKEEIIEIVGSDTIETDAGSGKAIELGDIRYLTANVNIGYDFEGWYLGDELLSKDLTYKCELDGNVYAKFTLKNEFKYLEFESNDTTCVVTGLKEGAPYDLVIPEGVTKIASEAFKGAKIGLLTLPESLDEIGNHAFALSKLIGIKFNNIPSILGENIDYNSDIREILYPEGEEIQSIADSLYRGGNYYYFTIDQSFSYTILGDFVMTYDEGDWCAIRYLSDSKDVIFPEGNKEIKEYELGYELFYNNKQIESVSFSDSVTCIGYESFYGCSNLKEINFGKNITDIDSYAFYDCDSLAYLNIPSNVTYIGRYAFYGCDNLKIVSIGEDVSNVELTDENGIYIGEYAFQSCDSLMSLSLGETVAEIDNEAFEYCNSLTVVTVGKNLYAITYDAFYGCYNLATINNYSKLNIEAGSSENGRIANYATTVNDYSNKTQEKTVSEKDYFKYLDVNGDVLLYEYTGDFENVIIPTFDGKKIYIGDGLFKNNKKIKSVILNDDVIHIGEYAFSGCESLENIDLLKVESISSYAFSGCKRLTNVTMNNVISIGLYAFSDCISIFEITLPASLTNISDYAFNKCYRLVEVINESGITIEKGSYNNGYVGYYALNIITKKEDSNLKEENGFIIYNDNGKKILISVIDKTIKKLVIDSSIYDMCQCALFGLDTLEELDTNILDESLDYYFGLDDNNGGGDIIIGPGFDPIINGGINIFGSFNDSLNFNIEYKSYIPETLSKIVLLDDIDYIPSYAFKDLKNIKEITLNKNIEYIGENAFSGVSLEKLYYDGEISDWFNIEFSNDLSNPLNSLTADIYFKVEDNYEIINKIIIPDTVITLDDHLAGFNMEEVVLPDTIETISSYAFNGCKNLKKINFPESLTYIGDYAFSNTSIEAAEISENIEHLGNGAFKNTKIKSIIIPSNIVTIPSHLFEDCKFLQYVEIADGVENISEYAFNNCKSLYTLIIPNSIRHIYEYSFNHCENLEDVSLKDTYVEALTDYSFAYCSNLINFEFPQNLTSLSSTTFYGCDNFEATTYNNGCYVGTKDNPYRWLIKARAKTIVNCIVHEDCEKIFENAFSECKNLKKLVINSSNTDFECILKGLTKIEEITFPYVSQNSFGYFLFGVNNSKIPTSLKKITINGGDIYSNAFINTTSINTIIIDGVNEIGTKAFKDISSINVVVIDNVNTISESAFENCVNADFDLENIVSIGTSAFKNTGITEYVAGSHTTSIAESAFMNCINLETVDLTYFGKDKLGTYGSSIFSGCKKLNNVTLPTSSNVNSVGSSMFNSCYKLESINLPNNITRILSYAFASSGIKTIDFNKVTEVLDSAFRYSSLETVTIKSGMKLQDGSMANEANRKNGVFDNCKSLTSVTYNSEYYYSCTFANCTNLQTVNLGSNVTAIGSYMFYNCVNLTNINLGNITTIKNNAFENTGLTSFVTSNAIDIDSSAFKDCKELVTVSLTNDEAYFRNKSYSYPNYVYSQTTGIFEGCIKLENVTLPSSMTTINASVFKGCVSLKEFDFSKLVVISASAFENTGFEIVELPETVIAVQTEAFANCMNLKTLKFAGKFVNTSDYYGNNYEKQFYNCTSLEEVDMTGICDNITGYAFRGCSSLKKITFPETLTEIKYYAFAETGFIELTIPRGVNVYDNVFKSCPNLEKVTFNGVAKSSDIFSSCYNLTDVIIGDGVTTIAGYMFSGCFALKNLTLPESLKTIGSSAFSSTGLTSLVLNEGLTTIGSSAFSNCKSLSSVKLPSTLTSIGSSAFYNCIYLVEVYNLTSSLEITLGSEDNGYVAYYAKKIHTTDEPSIIVTTEDGYSFANFDSKAYLISYSGNSNELVLPESFEYDGTTISSYEIAGYAFYKNTDITSIIMPSSVKAIGEYAFFGCTSLNNLILSDNLENIGEYAFAGDSDNYKSNKITTITLPSTLTSIGNNAFYYNFYLLEVYDLTSLNIEKNSSNGYVGYYSKVIHKNLDEDSIIVKNNDYVFAYYDNVGYVVCYLGSENELVIPGSFTYNGNTITNLTTYESAFAYKYYKSLILEDGIFIIGSGSFKGCSIDYLELPNSISSFNYRPFDGSSIKIIKGNSFVISRTVNSTQYTNSSLKEAIVIDPSPTSTINRLYENQFNNCSKLEKVVIPKSIKIINSSAFYATENLKYLFYEGTKAEYDNISVNDTGNYGLYYPTKYYYSEEKPNDTDNNYWHYQNGEIVIWEE